MRNRLTRCGLIALMVGIIGVRIGAADCGYADAMRLHWERMRKMLTAIAAAMPEDKYDFRPVKEVRSFREMLLHMVEDGYTHVGYVAGMSREESTKLTEKYKDYKSRDELLRALNESYDYGDKILATLTDQNAMEIVSGMRNEKMTRVEAALVLFEDQMDHYGNFVVYLRMNGIVPPDTVEANQQRQKNQQNQNPQNKDQKPAEGHDGMNM